MHEKYVVIGTLNDSQRDRLHAANAMASDASEAMQAAIEATMRSHAKMVREHKKAVDAIWDELKDQLGMEAIKKGRYAFEIRPDGAVNIVDIEATHKLNCPVHGAQAEGQGKGN